MKLTAAQGKELRTISGMACEYCLMLIRDKKTAIVTIDEVNDCTTIAHTRCWNKHIEKKASDTANFGQADTNK